jgi:hypothetical protein
MGTGDEKVSRMQVEVVNGYGLVLGEVEYLNSDT